MRTRKTFDEVLWCIGEVNQQGEVVSIIKTFKYEKAARRWLQKQIPGEGFAMGPNKIPLQVFVGSGGNKASHEELRDNPEKIYE